MSSRLRPMGKPCLRSPRGALLVVAGVVALVTAPATAAYADHVKPLGWYAEEGAAPVTVQFEDVAADGATVLAAGADVDPAAGTETAVIYRGGEAGWYPETLPVPTGPSKLTDVAVSGSQEWAVGETGGRPLVLQNVAGAWQSPQLTLPAVPTSVAVDGTRAVIGDAEGNIHVVDLASGTATSEEALSAGAINGVELFAGAPGYAVADFGGAVADGNARIYELGSPPVPEPAMTTPGTAVDMQDLAATAPDQAVALDTTNRTAWSVDEEGAWFQEAPGGLPADRALRAVASTPGGQFVEGRPGWATEFLSGAVGAEGAVWRRTRFGDREETWSKDALPPGTPSVAGVAPTAWNAAWAVGANGTVLRYWTPPDPDAHAAAEQAAAEEAYRQEQERLYQEQLAAEEAERQRLAEEQRLYEEQLAAEQAAAEQAAAEQAAAEQAAAEQAAAEEATAQQSSAPPPPPPVEQDEIDMNGVVIDDTAAERRRASRTGQRLLKNVRVVRRGQRLIVRFRLTARARVGLVAKRGGRVIAKKPMRRFRKGRRRIVLRFSGRPPTSLKVVVRRVRAT